MGRDELIGEVTVSAREKTAAFRARSGASGHKWSASVG